MPIEPSPLPADEERARLVLRKLMGFREMRAAVLARRAGYTAQTMSDKLNGISRIGFSDARRFSDALGVEPMVFFMEPDDAVRWALDHAPALTNERGFAELPFVFGVVGSVVAAWLGVKAPELGMWIAENQRSDDSYVNYHEPRSANPRICHCHVTNRAVRANSVCRPRAHGGGRNDDFMHQSRGADGAAQCVGTR